MYKYIVLVLFFVLNIGCGDSVPKPVDFGGEDANKIVKMLEDIPDCSGNPIKISKLISKGGDTSYISSKSIEIEIVGKPAVDNTNATCELKICAPGGMFIGKKTWTFVKEGAEWKLKDAPVK
jgi:hypothetical protein